jgi:molybdate transport system substrate-binding protein
VVARSEAEIGFQQISEIIGVPGAELVGPLPAEVQQVTVLSAGVLTSARQPDAAAKLIQFLASEDADETIALTGLDAIKRR